MTIKRAGKKTPGKREKKSESNSNRLATTAQTTAEESEVYANVKAPLTFLNEGILGELASYYATKSGSAAKSATGTTVNDAPPRGVKDDAILASLRIELYQWRSETYDDLGLRGTMEDDYELVFEEFGPFLNRLATRLQKWNPSFLFDPDPPFVRDNGDKNGYALAGRIAIATVPM